MSEQFVLRWHYQEATLVGNLQQLFDTETLTDVTLSVDSQNLRAHRLVLAMCSVYFFQLFQDMGDTHHPVVVLHNVGLDDIKAILSFIYRGQCVVSKEQLPSLLSVAKLLKIQGLCDMKVPERNIVQQTSDGPVAENDLNESKDEYPSPHKLPEYDGTRCETSKEKTIYSAPKPPTLWEKTVPVFPDGPPPNDNDPGYSLPIPKKPPKDSSETCKCFLCGKYLSNQYNLRVHMETHEEAYHACQSCPHVSRSRDALRKHVSYRHPEEYHTRKRRKID